MDIVNFAGSPDGLVLLSRFQQHSIQCPKIQYRDADADDFVFADLEFELMASQRVYLIEIFNHNNELTNGLDIQTLSLVSGDDGLNIVVRDVNVSHLLGQLTIPLMDVWTQYLAVPVSKHS